MWLSLITSTSFKVITSTGAIYYLGKSRNKNPNKKNNDVKKIIKIAENNNLLRKKEDSLRIYRKYPLNDHKGNFIGWEYIFKIPLGLGFSDFQAIEEKFKDGLNNASQRHTDLKKLKKLKLDKTIIKQIQDIFNGRIRLNKALEMSYDGMLRMKVYDFGLPKKSYIDLETIEKAKDWNVPIGLTYDDILYHDFEELPFVLVGGVPGSGKSNLLNLIITALLHRYPDAVSFSLIDLKGGLEFGCYENLPQVKHFAISAEEAERDLTKVRDEMAATFQKLRKTGTKKVQELGIKNRHFVIIDEAAELFVKGKTKEEKETVSECEKLLVDIIRRGRASGIKCLVATQYPTKESIPSSLKRNLYTRIAYSLDTDIASRVVLDEGGAEKIPKDIKGRGIYKVNGCKTMQTFRISEELIKQVVTPKIIIKAKERKENDTRKKAPTAEKRVPNFIKFG